MLGEIRRNSVCHGALPAEEDEYRLKTRVIHSLFHLFQENEGVIASTFNSTNMDEKEARLWIKLEWKALKKAINTKGEDRQLAIRMLLYSEVPTGTLSQICRRRKQV